MKLVTWLLLVFVTLVTCNPFERSDEYETSTKEPAFGIEFTLDHLISSVTLANHSTYGLSKIPGGEAYQSVMRRYLETCRQVHTGEQPRDKLLKELDRTWKLCSNKERDRQDGLIRKPDRSWKDYFDVEFLRKPLFSPAIFEDHQCGHDPEVEILTDAVKRLKTATAQEMVTKFDVEEPRTWAYTRMVVPDFFWTTETVKPDPDDPPEKDSFWYHRILEKFVLAGFQNKLRTDADTHWQELLARPLDVFFVSPASLEIMSFTRKHHCRPSNDNSDANNSICGPKTLSPMSIVIRIDNSCLSLWLGGPNHFWTPWSTFVELGGHAVPQNERSNNTSSSYWQRVISKIDNISDWIEPPYRGAVDLILSGDAWSDDAITTLKEELQTSEGAQQIEIKNIVYQPDVFAASKRAARWGKYHLETWKACYMVIDDPAHDEL